MVRAGRHSLLAGIPFLAIAALGGSLSLQTAAPNTELTLPEFRALIRSEGLQENQQTRAVEVFSRLLAAQGKVAAARQSLDRLSGWHKAALARLQAQNAPASDEELLRFAEAKAVASVARFEAERREMVQVANLLLKRSPDSPLVALMEAVAAALPAKTEKDPNRSGDRQSNPAAGSGPAPGSAQAGSSSGAGSPADAGKKKEPVAEPPLAPQSSAAAGQEVSPGIASRKAQFEKEMLPLGDELLSKMYQSYLFGGIPVTALLWQEHEAFETELEYRLLLAEAEKAGNTEQKTGNREQGTGNRKQE
jgi:hypothetical protein